MKHQFTCSQCGENKEVIESTFTTGYGVNQQGDKFCYECCAIADRETMRSEGKTWLYFDNDAKKVTNWLGSLVFKVLNVRKGWHNWAGVRYDYWFIFEGYIWHGYTIGDMSQIAHCKKTKEQVNKRTSKL